MADKDKLKGMRKELTRYGDEAFSLFLRKSFIKGAGYGDDALDRFVIGIANTGSDFNPCHGNSEELIAQVRAGVLVAGGLPMVFPTISLHESFAYPTSMYLRNLMAMDTEEMLKSLPVDAVVLVGGCDKTVPAQVMGALSANIPFIQLVTGPMSTGSFRGERVGACTDCRRLWGDFRSGRLTEDEISGANDALVPTVGTCGVMGTASTMALLVEALGLAPLGSATAPAVSADRRRIAEETGQLAVDIARRHCHPADILTLASFENALRVLLAVGGSTNAILHLTAMAGRLGIKLSLERLDELSRHTPVIVDLKPSGTGYMEDLHAAGGFVRILSVLSNCLDMKAMTVTGKTLGQELNSIDVPDWPQNIIRSSKQSLYEEGGLAVLYGNLAPQGAIIKQAAASQHLLSHTGRAVVFENMADLATRIDDPELEVSQDDILVLRQIGPKGAPGMPEAGLIPIPKKLAQKGIKDMVRISDGRMSGTAAGTIILHVAPESAVGGPLSLLRTGDKIQLDVAERQLNMLVSEKELDQRRAEQLAAPLKERRGYEKLFFDHVLQAPDGVDFDFMQAMKESD